MIPVQPAPEPAEFDQKVRRSGLAWLAQKGLPTDGPLPANTDVSPYWRACLPELYRAYRGICAYVAMEIPPVTGAPSADHFVAKSKDASRIYEWLNYRLASAKMNSRKRDFEDVLDPFEVPAEVFHLDLATGAIRPNPALGQELTEQAQATIERLDLDDQECRSRRVDWFEEYRSRHIDEDYLRRKSPFVWHEAVRQGALR